MTQDKILITGATGHIGRELVSLLVDKPYQIYAGSRSGEAQGKAPGRKVDFTDPKALAEAFEGIDSLFLLFPLVPEKITYAKNAVAAAKAAGVKHIIRSSGAGADAQSSVAIAKLQGEIDEIIATSGIDYTLIRPATFMQNYATYYADMIKSGTVYLSVAQSKTSYIDTRDIALAIEVILRDLGQHRSKAYTLTGAQAIGVSEALDEISKVTGRKVDYVPVSEAMAVDSMRKMGMDEWNITMLSSLNQITAAGYTSGVTDDFAKLTGQSPRAFSAFATDFAQSWL